MSLAPAVGATTEASNAADQSVSAGGMDDVDQELALREEQERADADAAEWRVEQDIMMDELDELARLEEQYRTTLEDALDDDDEQAVEVAVRQQGLMDNLNRVRERVLLLHKQLEDRRARSRARYHRQHTYDGGDGGFAAGAGADHDDDDDALDAAMAAYARTDIWAPRDDEGANVGHDDDDGGDGWRGWMAQLTQSAAAANNRDGNGYGDGNLGGGTDDDAAWWPTRAVDGGRGGGERLRDDGDLQRRMMAMMMGQQQQLWERMAEEEQEQEQGGRDIALGRGFGVEDWPRDGGDEDDDDTADDNEENGDDVYDDEHRGFAPSAEDLCVAHPAMHLYCLGGLLSLYAHLCVCLCICVAVCTCACVF